MVLNMTRIQPVIEYIQGLDYLAYLNNTIDRILWHELNETSGSTAFDSSDNGFDGTYGGGETKNAATLLGQPAIGFTSTTTSTHHVQFDHTNLQTVFNKDLGSLSAIVKMSSTDWGSATVMTFVIVGVDSSNYIIVYKPAANTLRFRVRAGAVNRDLDYTVVAGDHGKWLPFWVSWDSSGNNILTVKASSFTGAYPAGTWSGSLAALFCRSGVNSLAAGFIGQIGQFFMTDTALTAVQRSTAYTIFRYEEPGAA